jgi:hypothetical protein
MDLKRNPFTPSYSSFPLSPLAAQRVPPSSITFELNRSPFLNAFPLGISSREVSLRNSTKSQICPVFTTGYFEIHVFWDVKLCQLVNICGRDSLPPSAFFRASSPSSHSVYILPATSPALRYSIIKGTNRITK